MAQLESFPNPHPGRDYTIEHTVHEFTSVCPKTGQPDFGTLVITYVPARRCVELKSLKLYLWHFREVGVFCEQLAVDIRDKVVETIAPREVTVGVVQKARGGITIEASSTYP